MFPESLVECGAVSTARVPSQTGAAYSTMSYEHIVDDDVPLVVGETDPKLINSLYPNSSLQCLAALSNGLVTGENTALSPNSSVPATVTDSNSCNASVVLLGTGNIEGHSVASTITVSTTHNEHGRKYEKSFTAFTARSLRVT